MAKVTRCKVCPRCGHGGYRLVKADSVLPKRKVRQCRKCSMRYRAPTPKWLVISLIVVGGGLIVPLLVAVKQNGLRTAVILHNPMTRLVPAALGVLLGLFGLLKLVFERSVRPPERDGEPETADARPARRSKSKSKPPKAKRGLLGNIVAPLENSQTPATSAGATTAAAPAAPLQAPAAPAPTPTAALNPAQASPSPAAGAAQPSAPVAAATKSTLPPAQPTPARRPITETVAADTLPPLTPQVSTAPAYLQRLRRGVVIPAHPLALNEHRKFDEFHMRGLTRYYLAAGAGGIAAAVHTTQFAIRDPEHALLRPVLKAVVDEIIVHQQRTGDTIVKVAGICGETRQALEEAEQAVELGYDAGLINVSALKTATDEQLIWHCREVAKAVPLFGFYLNPAVGGRKLSFRFWRQFAEIPNVVAIKIATFNRYQTIDVLRAVAEAGRALNADNPDGIAIYTGNDDNIIADLIGQWTFNVGGKPVTQRIVGGLLGHWACWTKAAVESFESVRKVNTEGAVPHEAMLLNRQVTDMNAAVFDAANDYKGCIPGVHEVLRRQKLITGNWCLDPNETLSPGQSQEIDRVIAAYPHLTDDAFVAENLSKWHR